MIVLDRLLAGSLKFVLSKVADAVDAELGDEPALREALIAAQMRLELGEIDSAEFARIEADVLSRLREIRARRAESRGEIDVSEGLRKGELRISGIEAEIHGDRK